jgi:hypothetical protein
MTKIKYLQGPPQNPNQRVFGREAEVVPYPDFEDYAD